MGVFLTVLILFVVIVAVITISMVSGVIAEEEDED